MNLKDYMKYLNRLLNFNNYFKILFILVFLFSDFILADSYESDSLKANTDSLFITTKSPTYAMLQSAILPGLGQFYNESYWKIPVVWGFLGYYLSVWVSQNNKYNFYKKEYNKSISESNLEGDLKLKSFRNFYHNQRDEFTIYIFITYFLNIVDAYVDAHLFDFNVEPHFNQLNLSFRISL